MPLRLSSLPVLIRRPQPLVHHPKTSHFHATPAWKSDSTDHYETLGLQPNASQAAIKKQFYHLSKLHHPDHNPNDAQASTRFVQISSAYATLGSPSKRERYDREHHHSTSSHSSSSVRKGSHSSSSTPFGSRPASGLSKRRTAFHGPPSSFYRSGGWGAHGSKRQAQADAASSASADAAAGSAAFGANMGGTASGIGNGVGTGFKGFGWDSDVPHFDREGHFRTQEQQEQRKRRKAQEEENQDYGSGGGTLINFILIGGILSFALFLPALFEGRGMARKKKEGE